MIKLDDIFGTVLKNDNFDLREVYDNNEEYGLPERAPFDDSHLKSDFDEEGDAQSYWANFK